jgi:hypothetical protein
MKKFWIVLLSVALIMAFAVPVCATDVKFSGSYVVQGYYDNNRALLKDGGASLSNTWQRLRVQTDFQVQEGLKLTTRFDAMEKIWGASRNAGGTYTPTYSIASVQSTGSGEAENIKFQIVYATVNLWGGVLKVGYQQQGGPWGPAFGDYGDDAYGPRITYTYAIGPWTLTALYENVEGATYYSSLGPAGNVGNSLYQVDQQTHGLVVNAVYNWNKGSAGMLYKYVDDSAYGSLGAAGQNPNPATDTGWKRLWHVFDPFVKAQLGPLYVEAEVIYLAGKTRKYETSSNGIDQTKDGLSAYVSATYDFAPMYAGLTLVYVPGDDKGTADKDEAGWPGMIDFNPCLMLFNYDLARWNGNIGPNGGQVMSNGITNAQFAQVFVGVKPVPKLDIKAAYAIAQADKDGAATGWQSKNYGSEFDLTATYKIYNNLSYMVGFGYLWAGDYFKGTSATQQVDNDYLVTHKLTLTF